ncbi:MAG: CRISPR-associated endonuclease Cas2 [Cyanobacteriota bacterium]
MSSQRQQLWIVAYDTPSSRRRRKLATLLEGYGQRVQWSVFECDLEANQFKQLHQRLCRLVAPEEDSVRLWPITERSRTQMIHVGRTIIRTEWQDRLI